MVSGAPYGQPYSPAPGQPYPPQYPKKRKKWPWIVGGILLVMVLGCFGVFTLILGGTKAAVDGLDANQKGKKLTERVYLSEASKPRLFLVATRLGIIDGGGGRKKLDFDKAKGKQFVGEIVEESYDKYAFDDSGAKVVTGKGKKSKISYGGFYAVNDERVKDVPKDETVLRVLGGNGQQQKKQELDI